MNYKVNLGARCKDCSNVTVYSETGNLIVDHQGYVPSGIPGRYGDNVELQIDVVDGVATIKNWNQEAFEDWLKEVS